MRISFAGGGADKSSIFFKNTSYVLNTTISLYSRAHLKVNKGLNVSVTSSQLGACVAGRNLKEAATNAPEDFKLIFSVLLLIAPKRGFDLFLDSDCTIGAGLGGSSAMCVAIVQSFNALRQNKWSKSEVADIAFQAERLSAVIEGGWQINIQLLMAV